MFGGIIETTGTIKHIMNEKGGMHFRISHQRFFDDLTVGASMAVNGVCLTVTDFSEEDFDVTVVPQTLRLTNLEALSINRKVNLERALKLTDRLSGHLVQGHVDSVGEILELKKEGEGALMAKINFPPGLTKYIVNKGFIALDGMSITIVQVEKETFTVAFVPHTQQRTLVNEYRQGSRINIEVDIIGRYVERFIGVYQ